MRLLVFSILSLLLMFADYRFREVDLFRSTLSTLVAPIQIIVDIPSQVLRWVERRSTDYESLYEENDELKSQALILQLKLQKMVAITTENIRLRELLDGAKRVEAEVVVAEVIGVDVDPFTHEIVVNRGASEGVVPGQPVLDASGVMGQVISVNRYTSRVLLISDARHALPVEVNRNSVRAIAVGNGISNELELLHLPDTADIKQGDILITSGLAGRFPQGYPVAIVNEVRRDPGQTFAEVKATPLAALTRSRQVLLVTPEPESLTVDDAETSNKEKVN